MPFFTTSVPNWVSLLFSLTFPITIFLIANAARQAAQRAGLPLARSKQIWWGIVVFYMVYLGYVTSLSGLGYFRALTVPPPIFLLTAIPLLVVYFGVIGQTALYKTLLAHASLSTLIRIHRFRFVGVFFLINLWYGALPQRFALVAGVGDILTAVLAIWVAGQVAQRRPGSYRAALIWNLIGLGDIISVLITALLTISQATAGNADALRLANIGSLPFCWIPALAPATIIFLHVAIFKKLKMERQALTAGTLATSPSAKAAA